MDRPRRYKTRVAVFASTLLFAPLGLTSAGGCGPTLSGIEGIACVSDSDCNPGLQCLSYKVFADGGRADAGCVSGNKACLRPCRSNADCREGPGLTCVTFCGGTAACEAASDVRAPEAGSAEAEASGEASAD
jgi:hypothetical protein